MKLIPAGTWVAVVPTMHKCMTTVPEPRASFFWCSETTFLESLLDPSTARLIRGVLPYSGVFEAKDSGRRGPAIEVNSDGEITFGRELLET